MGLFALHPASLLHSDCTHAGTHPQQDSEQVEECWGGWRGGGASVEEEDVSLWFDVFVCTVAG